MSDSLSRKEVRESYRQAKIHGYSDVDAFIYSVTNHLSAVSQSESNSKSFEDLELPGYASNASNQW